MVEPILRLVRVSKLYATSSGEAVVLREVSLEVSAGESIAIMGPSGSGKSTLLQIIGTLERATSGEVWLGGEDLSRMDEAGLARVRNRRIGFVFQAHHLLPQCSVLENVLLPALAFSAAAPSETLERARRLLHRVGLGDRVNQRAALLSGGERQRTAVVRALINQPGLLLADEPTGSLDHTNAQELGELLRQLNREENLTLLIVTHSAEIARSMGRTLQLTGGRLLPDVSTGAIPRAKTAPQVHPGTL
jgi:lipoprotein-releasing system ATP-binding protein